MLKNIVIVKFLQVTWQTVNVYIFTRRIFMIDLNLFLASAGRKKIDSVNVIPKYVFD